MDSPCVYIYVEYWKRRVMATSKVYVDGFVFVIDMSRDDMKRLADEDDPIEKFYDAIGEIEHVNEFSGPHINGLCTVTVQLNPKQKHLLFHEQASLIERKIRSAWNESFKVSDIDKED